MSDGVERLRRDRGRERVTFSEVADHLADFASREPGSAETIDELARFLAGVEHTSHDHEGRGPTLDPSTPVV